MGETMGERHRTVLGRHGARMVRWRWVVVPLWLLTLVVGILLAGRIGGVLTDEFTQPGSEAGRGAEVIGHHFGTDGGHTELTVVYRHPDRTIDDPAFRTEMAASLARAAAVVPGAEAVSALAGGGADLVAEGGHLAIATLRLPIDADTAMGEVPALRQALGQPAGFDAPLLGGDAARWHDEEPILARDLVRAELIVLPAALLLLLVFFGSFTSALVTLLVAACTVILALAGTWVAGQATDIASMTLNVIILVGVGIGIDYALLMVGRFRAELAGGAEVSNAVATTTATAGRAVLLSGCMVAIGLAALVMLPVPFLRSMGIGGLMVPVAAVATSLVALPALLSMLGHRIDTLRVYPRAWSGRPGRVFGPIGRLATRRAWPVATVVGAGLVALALQAGTMNLHPDGLASSPDVEANRAGLVVRDQFGGAASPNVYVIDSGRSGGMADATLLGRLSGVADQLRTRDDIVAGVVWPSTADPEQFIRSGGGVVDATGRYALMSVAAHGDPASAEARAVDALMRDHTSEIEGALPGGEVLITGEPAATQEFTEALATPFPYLVVAVLAMTLLAMSIALRGWVVPLISVVVTAVSLLASYGVLVLIFQEGVAASLVGLDGPVRGIAPWVPLFVFAFLFGISMDYQVFLVERIRELRLGGATTEEAISGGVRDTGRTILAAAAIMAVAFAGFGAGQLVEMKQFGVALAVAIAIDALLVRPLLVPAVLHLAGRRALPAPRSTPGVATVVGD